MRAITVQHAKIQHGIAVHDPYECEEEEYRMCWDYFVSENADRTYDERKEQA